MKLTKEQFEKDVVDIKHMLWLNHWGILVKFVDSFEWDDGLNTYWRLSYIDKPHKLATIQFNWKLVSKKEEYKLFIIHELLHIYLHTHSFLDEQKDYLINRIGFDMRTMIYNNMMNDQERSIANLQYVIYNMICKKQWIRNKSFGFLKDEPDLYDNI